MIVKKYSNRRLYDTEASRYITLDELAEKVRAGADARVADANTGEDLTQSTLAQIILESRGASRLLPVPLLTQLIRMGDDNLAEFLGRYLSTALELYLQAKQGAQALSPFNPFASVPFAATSALARLFLGGGLGWGDAPPAPQTALAHHVPGAPPPPVPTPAAEAPGPLVSSPSPSPPPASPPPASPPPASPPPASPGDDVAALRRELEALKQAFLAGAGAAGKAAAKARPRAAARRRS